MRPAIRLGRPISSELNRSTPRQSSGRTLYFAASTHHRSCSSRSFSGFACGEVVGLREVLVDVVELPRRLVGVELAAIRTPRARTTGTTPSSRRDKCPRLQPISKYCVVRRLLAFASSKRVREADPLDRLLLHAVEVGRRR